MKIVIAPDSFKGSLSAKEAGTIILRALSSEMEGLEAAVVPMADGGEGTLEALVFATGGKTVEVEVQGPLLKRVRTCYGVLGDRQTAVIETANTAGLTMVHEEERNPLYTSSCGVGEAIRHALDAGYRRLIVGLGGSATNDGGMGMLQALGAVFEDSSGRPVAPVGGRLKLIDQVRLDSLDPRLSEVTLLAASDVTNPLCGEQGSSAVFGPQKGATAEQVQELDRGLDHYARLIEECLGRSLKDQPGAGAAGGLGFGLLVLGGRIQNGAQIVADASGLEEVIREADWVITGEGQTDFQTGYGKVPMYVAQLAQKHGAKPVLISGSLGEGVDSLYDPFVSLQSILCRPMSVQEAMREAEPLLYQAARDWARLLQASRSNN